MLSRHRLMLAINHKEPDHVPLAFDWGGRGFFKDRSWRDQFERVKRELKLGLDPILTLQYVPTNECPAMPTFGWNLRPDVKVKFWREPSVAGEEYAVLFKEYHTEKGVLRQVVRQTPDWPHGDFIPLWDDFNLPRSRAREYLIKKMDDLEAFESLFNEPTEKELRHFLDKAEYVKRFADKYGLLVRSTYKDIKMTDAAVWSLGIENMICMIFRNPDLVHRLLDILLERSLKILNQILEADIVDVITYEGWSESFFPPKQYEAFIVPRLKKLIEMAHRSGKKVYYAPRNPPYDFFRFFKEIGVDIFGGCDPVHGNKDLLRIKQMVRDEVCLWGGVDSTTTLGMGTKRQIEDEVTEAIRILGPGGGFILSAFDSLDAHTPWSNIEHMIKVWRKKGRYPINLELR